MASLSHGLNLYTCWTISFHQAQDIPQDNAALFAGTSNVGLYKRGLRNCVGNLVTFLIDSAACGFGNYSDAYRFSLGPFIHAQQRESGGRISKMVTST